MSAPAPLILLASQSPRRLELLRGVGAPVRVISAGVPELRAPGEAPQAYVHRLAAAKAAAGVARWVAERGDSPHAALAELPTALIAADTVVALDDHVLEKPVDVADAIAMLTRLSGRTHEVFTGVAIWAAHPGKALAPAVAFETVTRVTFRTLSPADIEGYANSPEPHDKAGAYAAQGVGTCLIERIEGSYTNVVGLPLAEVVEALSALGIFNPFRDIHGGDARIASPDRPSSPAPFSQGEKGAGGIELEGSKDFMMDLSPLPPGAGLGVRGDGKPDELALRIASLKLRIAEACARAGRDVSSVRLIAVGKGHSAETLRAAYTLGLRTFGENYVQEWQAKRAALPADIEWHFVGRVQTNKLKHLLGHKSLSAPWLHAIDRFAQVEALVRRLSDHSSGDLKGTENSVPILSARTPLPVLMMVNLAREPGKGGVDPDAASALAATLADATQRGIVDFRGLMALPPAPPDDATPEVACEQARPWFAALRHLRDRLAQETGLPLPELSMGMSADFPAAIAEGATLIRIGSELFGPRPAANMPRAPGADPADSHGATAAPGAVTHADFIPASEERE